MLGITEPVAWRVVYVAVQKSASSDGWVGGRGPSLIDAVYTYQCETRIQVNMFEDWKKWCEEVNVQKGTAWAFGKEIRALLELDGHTHNSPRYRLGKFQAK